MKIRSQTELQDYLDEALAWRKRELTTIRFKIVQSGRNHEKAALLRAALPILYAHWEGFVKDSATAYLEYVSRQRVVLRELKGNFMALAIRETILAAGASRKVRSHQSIIDTLLDNFEQSMPLTAEDIVVTDNLSSSALREIMETIGIEFGEDWQKRAPLIDHALLKNRNEIAHGERTPVDLQMYEQLHRFVLQGLEEFKLAIENAAAAKSFRRSIPLA